MTSNPLSSYCTNSARQPATPQAKDLITTNTLEYAFILPNSRGDYDYLTRVHDDDGPEFGTLTDAITFDTLPGAAAFYDHWFGSEHPDVLIKVLCDTGTEDE